MLEWLAGWQFGPQRKPFASSIGNRLSRRLFGEKLEEVPVLSDVGGAIGKFCLERKPRRGRSNKPAFMPTDDNQRFHTNEPVPGLIHSLSLFLEMDEATTAAYIIRFCELTNETSETIKAKCPVEKCSQWKKFL